MKEIKQTRIHYTKQKWINEVVPENNIPEHDYHVNIGSMMNVLQVDPNKILQEYPYLESEKKEEECIEPDKLNIGVVLETSRESNAHDEESVNSALMQNIFNETHNVISLDEYLTNEKLPKIYNKHFNYN